MKDLVAINGPWQVITFLNFFYAEYENRTFPKVTVLFFEIDEDLKKVCKTILLKYDFVDDFIDFKQDDVYCSSLYSKVWISKLFSITPKLILEQFSTQPIHLFEEGIHSYVTNSNYNYRNIIKKATSIKSFFDLSCIYFNCNMNLNYKFPDLVFKKHKSRCVVQYDLFPFRKNKVSNVKITDKYLKKILSDAHESLGNTFKSDGNKKSVIIIGQYFSKLNLIEENLEIEIYSKIIEQYLEQDYIVYWKGHPRFNTYDEQLKYIFKEKIVIFDNHLIPLEILLVNYINVEICGVSSSALLYLKWIFNYKTTQAIQLIEDKINVNCFWYNDFIKIFSIVKNNISELK